MKLDEGTFCPLLKKRCIGRECAWMTQLRGTNPNTGQEIDELFCAISALPMLLIENAKEVRQGAAATESFRNELVSRADAAAKQRQQISTFPLTTISKE